MGCSTATPGIIRTGSSCEPSCRAAFREESMASFIDGDVTMRALQFSLDGLSKRTQVATNDIANADTPNYKSSVVSFEDSLKSVIDGTKDNPMPLTLTDGAHIDPIRADQRQAAIVETPLYNRVSKN